jgi:hypothetical protein
VEGSLAVDRRRSVLVAVAAALASLLGLASPAAAAPSARTTITPGVLMLTPVGSGGETSKCTADFVFRGPDDIYLGYAAHCAAGGDAMGLSGCDQPTTPVGTPVLIEGANGSRTEGLLAYTSWGTMQERGESNQTRCFYNDFALVVLDPADRRRVDPTVPRIGGPTGLDTDGTEAGEPVYSYQPQHGGTAVKEGESLGMEGGGLAHRVETSPAGRPGDSGSGYLNADGEAFGVLSTLFLDGTRTNGVTDLAQALSYANRYGGIGRISLVRGDEPFTLRP